MRSVLALALALVTITCSPPQAVVVATPIATAVQPLKASYAALTTVLDAMVQGYSTNKPQELTIGSRRALYFQAEAKYNFKSLVWAHRSFVLWMYGYNAVS